jgi:hypothetical protein
MRHILIVAMLGACAPPYPAPRDSYEQMLPSGPCSVEGVTGSVPGVTLAIRSADCVYQAGQDARFVYEITTDATVPAIDVPASIGCGSCQPATTDPRSWVGWVIQGASSDGADQTFCLCDVGCCAPEAARTIKPATGTVSDVIDWSGRNWHGPSDTGMPQGAVFPPGIYQVKVTFAGRERGSVVAELPIEIIPAR